MFHPDGGERVKCIYCNTIHRVSYVSKSVYDVLKFFPKSISCKQCRNVECFRMTDDAPCFCIMPVVILQRK
jgi:hypothetical protein